MLARFPHACGGEPLLTGLNTALTYAFPTLVGVNRHLGRVSCNFSPAFPTLVGVNLTTIEGGIEAETLSLRLWG